jgi:hypothetical protein
VEPFSSSFVAVVVVVVVFVRATIVGLDASVPTVGCSDGDDTVVSKGVVFEVDIGILLLILLIDIPWRGG